MLKGDVKKKKKCKTVHISRGQCKSTAEAIAFAKIYQIKIVVIKLKVLLNPLKN